MKLIKLFLILFITLPLISCSKEKVQKSTLEQKSLELQVLEAYEDGIKALRQNDILYAAKKFNEAETLFPQSTTAPKAALMAAYSYYSQDYYEDAIGELQRFIKVYPFHKNIDYAHYLLGLSWYEQIIDEKKDLQTILKAKEEFLFIIEKYPETEYALDAEFKLDLINDTLASKEMYIGRYYYQKKKWISAINRFKTVIDEYETTIYTEEALHRLVEVYYTIGLELEAKKYAKLLGYNYQSSQWYERSYIVFNKMYKKNNIKFEKDKKKKSKFLKKFKSLFNVDE